MTTVRDSCDINTVLRFLLAIDDDRGRPMPSSVEAEAAAIRLISHANHVLGAGLMPGDISRNWPRKHVKGRGHHA